MPKAYEAMRDKFASGGMSYDAAQGKAARIYNSLHPEEPVTRTSHTRKIRKTRKTSKIHKIGQKRKK